MKKTITTNKTFAYGLFAVILALAFFACDNENNDTHTHDYGTEWKSNATQHWRECSCGDKTDVADHTGDPCTVCGYASGSQNPDICECNGIAEDCDCVDCDCPTCEEEPPENQPPTVSPVTISGATPEGGKYKHTDTIILGGNTAVAGNTYAWTVTTDPAGRAEPTLDKTAAAPAVSGFEKGVTYTFTLTVTNNGGSTQADPVTVAIAGNAAPTANAAINDHSPVGGKYIVTLSDSLSLTLNSIGSKDDDGTISRAWELETYTPYGTLSNAPRHQLTPANNGETANVTLKKAGEYVFKLTVTDNDGATATKEVTVVVEPRIENRTATATVAIPQASFTFGGQPNLDFSVSSYNINVVTGTTSDFDPTKITYTFSSTNPNRTAAQLNEYVSTGKILASEYSNMEYPTITQTFYYNGQPNPIGSRSVIAIVVGSVFSELYDNVIDQNNITYIPATTLNLSRGITETTTEIQ